MFVYAHDPTGNRIGKHELKIGDWVDYKPARMHGITEPRYLLWRTPR